MKCTAYLTAMAGILALPACSTSETDDVASMLDSFQALAGETATPVELPGRVRIVNLWVNDGAPGAIDVFVSRGRKLVPLFTNVPFGTVTEYASVEAEAVLHVHPAGKAENSDRSMAGALSTVWLRSDLESGRPLTVTFRYAKPLSDGGPSAVGQAFQDAGDFVYGSMPARPVQGALLVTDVTAANAASGASETYFFGVPGKGCLLPAGSSPSSGRVSLGGTGTAEYDVPPGPMKVAAYASDDRQCERAPILGPIDIDVAADRRNYLFVYGTSRADRRLLFTPAGKP